MMRNNHKKGFTLSELLIVVAIIGVLVAISIPIFTSQLHKAEVATDWANVRSYYAQIQYDFIETGEINNSYIHDIGQAGMKSFELNGQTIKLKAGSMWVRHNYGLTKGYNILYACNKHHLDCQLVLPE